MNFQLTTLAAAIDATERAMVAHLATLYPVGSSCGVVLSPRQKKPSKATVRGHVGNSKGGFVIVELDEHKPDTRLKLREIHPDCIRFFGERTTA